eukprot:403335030
MLKTHQNINNSLATYSPTTEDLILQEFQEMNDSQEIGKKLTISQTNSIRKLKFRQKSSNALRKQQLSPYFARLNLAQYEITSPAITRRSKNRNLISSLYHNRTLQSTAKNQNISVNQQSLQNINIQQVSGENILNRSLNLNQSMDMMMYQNQYPFERASFQNNYQNRQIFHNSQIGFYRNHIPPQSAIIVDQNTHSNERSKGQGFAMSQQRKRSLKLIQNQQEGNSSRYIITNDQTSQRNYTVELRGINQLISLIKDIPNLANYELRTQKIQFSGENHSNQS